MQGKNRTTYLVCLLALTLVFAGKLPAAFEENSGARPFGMAGVFTALADDCNAINWNAAGLVQLNNMGLELMFSKPFMGVDYDNLYSGYAGVALPIKGLGAIGVGYQMFQSEIYSESTVYVSAGVNVSKNFLSLGVTGKMLGINYMENDYTAIDPLFAGAAGYGSTAYGFDLSLLLKLGQAISIGAVAENVLFMNSLALGTSEYKLPLAYRAGVSFKLDEFVPGIELTYATKGAIDNYVLDIAGGFEWWTEDRNAALRAGGSSREITVGFTYMLGNIGLNYGFSYPFSGLSGTFGSHRLALNMEFGKRVIVKKEVAALAKKNKMKIAIMDMTSQNMEAGTALVVTELLRNNLFNTGRYSVLERANMDKLLKEQQFQTTGCSTTECAVELGKMLNMEQMLVGSVNKLGLRFYINARMVDVESGEIMVTATAECYSENDLSEASRDITDKLVKASANKASGAGSSKKTEDEVQNIQKTKIKIAVMDVQSQNIQEGVALVITELLRNNLFNAGKYLVLERANMDKLLKEQQFQSTGCTTTECAVELGKLLNMQEMVVSSVNKLGSKYVINSRMIDVKSGEIMATASAECYSENDLADACKEIVSRLIKR